MKASTVADYIAAQPKDVRAVLRQVRRTIRQALPRAEETISYRIPAYTQGGRAVIYFAAWKRHYSVYPVTRALAAAMKETLEPHEVERGTVRFSYTEPVPRRVIAALARFRAKEVARRRGLRGRHRDDLAAPGT